MSRPLLERRADRREVAGRHVSQVGGVAVRHDGLSIDRDGPDAAAHASHRQVADECRVGHARQRAQVRSARARRTPSRVGVSAYFGIGSGVCIVSTPSARNQGRLIGR